MRRWIFFFVVFPAALAWGDLSWEYELAVAGNDWPTAAELAMRLHAEEPGRVDLLGKIAQARLREGKVDESLKWLERWEASDTAAKAERLALRGEWTLAKGDQAAARGFWLRSYEEKPIEEVAERLVEEKYWGADERELFEQWMRRVAADFTLVKAIRVAAEAAVRQRDWSEVQRLVDTLNDAGWRSAMAAAAGLERAMKKRELLRRHDEAVRDLDSGLAYARRGHLFSEVALVQLASEDAAEALRRSPKMMLPRITLAVCHMRRGRHVEVQALQVVARRANQRISEEQRLLLDRLDHAASQAVVAPETYVQRAVVLAACGQHYLALQDLAAAGPAAENSAEGWACWGDCLLKQRKVDEAKTAYEKALALVAEHEPAWAGLGRIAWQRADYAEAVKRYGWLSERYPENEDYGEAFLRARERLR